MNGGTLEIGRLEIGAVVTYRLAGEDRAGYVRYFTDGEKRVFVQDMKTREFAELETARVRPLSVAVAG